MAQTVHAAKTANLRHGAFIPLSVPVIATLPVSIEPGDYNAVTVVMTFLSGCIQIETNVAMLFTPCLVTTMPSLRS